MLRKSVLMSASVIAMAGVAAASSAMAQDNYVGQILKTGANFCPRGTVAADGRLLSIAQESTLFALYGTTYGGDGVTTFALPDFRGRSSMNDGQGPGLTNRMLGERAGTETATMTIATMPRHEHTALIRTTSQAGDSMRAFRNYFATTPLNKYVAGTAPYAQLMAIDTLDLRHVGGDQAYDHRAPTLTIRYCVNINGIFPSQN